MTFASREAGHETHPTYFQPSVRRVIANAARWADGPRGAPLVVANQASPEPAAT